MTKTALITGATSGIGEAIAIRFAQEGYRLIVTGRRADRLNALKSKLFETYGASVLPLPFDVRDHEAVMMAIRTLPEPWTRIDVLVNNAGLALEMKKFQDGDSEDWDTMIDTNIKGLLYVTRAVTPGMIEAGVGHIINIGSIAGKEVYPLGNVYCATKFAVDALTKAMRIDLLEHGIKVTQIAPGAVETEFSQVRFKGDDARATKVYQGYQPLVAADIAEIAWFVVSQPVHVNISDILVTPAAQASAGMIHRKTIV
jgi:3-hydroxy acid dehydrogenase / malonic semialdehyde reductase